MLNTTTIHAAHRVALRVLLIQEDADARQTREQLATGNTHHVDVIRVARLADGLAHLEEDAVDVVLADLRLPDGEGIEIVEQLHERAPNVPLIVLCTSDDAGESLRAGACDYLVKGEFDGELLRRSVRYATKLRAEQTFLQTVVEQTTDALVIVSEDGIVRFIDPAATELFGRPADELLGRPFGYPLATDGGTTIEIPRPDGETAIAEIRVRPVTWQGERAALTTLHDVTQQVRSRRALQESEQRYRSLFERYPDIIARFDRQFRHLYVNAAVEQVTNVPPSDFLGKTNAELGLAGELLATWHAALRRVFETGREETIEFSFLTPDGRRWYNSRLVPEYAPDGSVETVLSVARDVTQRVEAERARRRSEERYRRLIEASPDAIALTELDGTILFTNQQGADMCRVEHPDVLMGENVFGCIAPEDRRRAVENAQKTIAAGTVRNAEYTLLRKDGTQVPVELSASVIRDADGRPDGFIMVTRDITKRRQAEAQLLESRGRLQALFDNALEAILLADDQARYVNANPAACELTGYPREELLQKYVWDLTPAADRDAGRATWRAFLDAGEQRGEYTIVRKDGATVETEYRSVANIVPGLHLSVIRDVTERKRAEEALRRSEARYRLLAQNATDVIARHTPGGTILYESPACRTVLGYEPSEMVGRSTFEFVHPEDVEDVRRTVEAATHETDTPYTLRYRMRRSDGSYIWVESTGKIIRDPDTGEVTEGITVTRDVTERHRRERELEAIASTAQALRRVADHSDIAPVVVDQLFQLLDLEGAAVALYDSGDDGATIVLTRGNVVLQRGARVAEESLLGQALRNGIVYDSNGTDAREFRRTFPFDTVVAVPLIAEQRPLGALLLGRDTPFVEAEMRVLTAVADIGASAINRTMLYEQTEQRLHRLTALHEIDRAIAGSVDLDDAFAVVLQQTIEQLNVDAASVLLFNRHTMTLEHAADRGFHTEIVTRSRVRLGEGTVGRAAHERKTVSVSAGEASEIARRDLWEREQFVTHYAAPLIIKGEVHGVLEVFTRTPLDPDQEWTRFLQTLAGQTAIAVDNSTMFRNLQRANEELRMAYDATIEGWARALDLRDEETEGHTRRVTEMTVKLAREMGIGDEKLVHIRWGALLHDIGKMGIPDNILLKPGPLDLEERVLMQKHPVYAYILLSGIDFLRPALDIPYCHHEKWDGSGYPRGLQRTQIPLAARIFAVADVYDALTSDRPYREAWPEEEARAYVREQAGAHFDPTVVEVFLRLLEGAS